MCWSGTRSYVTMGLATVTGVCDKSYGCVIGELGVAATDGRPYPSTGFTAVYVMAHEIGHNLGMFHDSTQVNWSTGYRKNLLFYGFNSFCLSKNNLHLFCLLLGG